MSTMERRRRQSPSKKRPNMCELRFVLLGKSETENSRVRNLILCGNEDALDSSRNNVKRFRGRVKERHVTVIESLHLLNPNISELQITQTLRECVSLSDPGPHVFILTLQCGDFTEEDMRRVKYVLNKFSDEALRRTIIITTDEETHTSIEIKHTCVHQLMKECGGGRLKLKDVQSEIFKRVDKMLKRNRDEYLTCEINEDVKGISVDEEQRRLEDEKISCHKDDGKHKRRGRKSQRSFFFSLKKQSHQNLNLVLCGNDGSLIVSVSKLLRGKRIKPSHERAVGKVCVKKEEKISGRQLSVVELPALSGLSEEEVMRQTLLSVTLCHPGVHAFICIVPVGPLNNDEKSEIEKILKMFDSRDHFMVLFTTDKTRDDTELTELITHSPESQSLISRCGGQYRLMGLKEPENSRQIPDLLDYIENMKTEPYLLQKYVNAQENRVRCETEEKYKEELKKMEDDYRQSEEKLKEMKVKHEDEARKQAEAFNESTERKLKHVLELTEMVKEKEEQHKAPNK